MAELRPLCPGASIRNVRPTRSHTATTGEPANPLREALDECRIGLVLLAVFSLFINVLILTSPIYMMQVYDRVLSSGRLETLVLLTAIAAVAIFVLGLLEMVRNKILVRIGQWLDRRLSPELIRASLR
jgi:ABC-type protease/lipase transport system fused ATPase/permease subunit